MSELINQLGIDFKLLLSQAINFLLVLIILRIFVYKPLLQLLEKRKKKIEEGIIKTEEAERRLMEVEKIKLEKIKEIKKEAMTLILEAEEKAKQEEIRILEEAKQKQNEILAQTELIIADKAKKVETELTQKAKQLVRELIVKVVELDPKLIDEALIEKALKIIRNQKYETRL